MSSIKKTVNIKGKIYNKSSLSVDKAKTLIIVDWDDTLYPTSWVVNNKIDLANEDHCGPCGKYVKIILNAENKINMSSKK